MTDVFIAGAAMTRFGRRPEGLPELMAEAAIGAMTATNRFHPEAIFVGTMNPEEFVGDACFSTLFADYLGRAHTPSLRVETGTSSGAAALSAAWAAIASGQYRETLVVAGEKMTRLPTPRVTEILSRMLDPVERAYGASMPALAAIVCRAYMRAHGLDGKDLAWIPVKNHKNGARNPYAHFQREVSLDEVLGSRMISDPLRLYEVCPISDGASAVLLTCEPGPTRIAGIGQGTDHIGLRNRDSLISFRATQEAARRAYTMAGLGPRDIQVAEVHDAFTPFELINLEDLGLYEPGKAIHALLNGETAIDGKLPVNTSGGLKARGHPVGGTALAQVVEIFWQLTGRAEGRQVEAAVGLTQSIGGLASNNWVVLLTRGVV